MTDADSFGPPDPREADRIGQLLKIAGRRPAPDPARMSSARAAARQEWIRVVKHRRWRVSLWALSAAALVVGAVGGSVWLASRTAPAAEVGALERATGQVFVTVRDGERRALTTAGVRLHAGDRLETPADGRASLSIDGDVSVRLDRGTSVVLDGPGRLTLDRGALYVDTGRAPRTPALRVHTALGVVQHVGTQFEVRLHEGSLGVKVREGAIVVEREGRRWTSRAGEWLVVAPERSPTRQPIAAYGADWSWIGEIARPFTLEGASVPQLLDWTSRELGARWEYRHPALRHRVERIVLHGSVEGLTPEEALAAVLPTCGLTYVRDGARLVISD